MLYIAIGLLVAAPILSVILVKSWPQRVDPENPMAKYRRDARFEDVKRTYPKPINISSQVLLDRERDRRSSPLATGQDAAPEADRSLVCAACRHPITDEVNALLLQSLPGT